MKDRQLNPQKLEQARRDFNIKTGLAARTLNVSTQTIRNWETGLTEPTVNQLLALCALYQIELDGVLDDA